MWSRVRSRLTYANVISSLALFLALAGGSYAAINIPKNSIGAKQLKKNAVTSVKVKPGSLLTSDFKSSARQGLRGPAGPRGLQGVQGVPGPVTGDLPSGATLRGVYNLDAVVPAASGIAGGSISFGLRLPSKPAIEIVGIGGPPTANCPGSLENPEAARGFLCVYKSSETNTSGIFPCDQDCDPNIAERYGAELFASSTAGGRIFADGSWAVTAQ
jgi:hypothetical protein